MMHIKQKGIRQSSSGGQDLAMSFSKLSGSSLLEWRLYRSNLAPCTASDIDTSAFSFAPSRCFLGENENAEVSEVYITSVEQVYKFPLSPNTMLSRFFSVRGLLAYPLIVGCASAATVVVVNGTPSHSISPLLCTSHCLFFLHQGVHSLVRRTNV